jgi:hypothetical protein
MKNFEQFKKDFKRDLLIKIVVSLKYGKANESPSEVARTILEVFKFNEKEVVFKQINKLSETHPEILDIFIKRGYEYDAREKDEKLSRILSFLKGGEIN